MDLMDFQSFIKIASTSPYQLKGQSFNGMDCFGFIQMWHKVLLDVDIDDRKKQASNPEGFQQGYEAKRQWTKLAEPINHSVIVMRSLWRGKVVPYGHCGMFYEGNVYHIEEVGGFQVIPFDRKRLTSRITDIRIHNKVFV